MLRRLVSAVSACLLIGALAPLAAPQASAVMPSPANVFHGVTPARLLETRLGPTNVTIDHQFEHGDVLGPAGTIEVTIAGRGGVPGDAGAVALNVTAIAPTATSYLTIYPTGATQPTASNLNLAAGRTLPNMVIVPLGTDGKISIYNNAGSTHLAIDVLGWYPNSPSAFSGLTPARLLDTRPGQPTVDDQFKGEGVLGAAATRDLLIGGRGGVPANAGAVALNVTAIAPTATSYLTIYPTGATQPTASNLNLAAGRTLPNMVIVPLGTDGKISIYNNAGSTHLAIDVLGWYPNSPSAFSGLTPARLLDTRPGQPTVDDQFKGEGVLGAAATRDLPITGRGGVPANAVAVALNVTAIAPTATSYLTIYPTGASRPTASNLNLAAGRTLPNMVIVPLGTGGKISIYNNAGSTHLAVDVLGWFPPGATVTRLNIGNSGAQTDGITSEPELTADGLHVVFDSSATNLVTGDTNGTTDTFVRNLTTNTNELVSKSTAGVIGNNETWAADISDDARFVVMYSNATNLVANDNNAASDVFVRDRQNGTTERISINTTTAEGNDDSYNGSISADGRYVVFESSASTLVPGDANAANDVFLRDRQTGTTTLISKSTAGFQGNGGSFYPHISSNGSFVVYQSVATNLVTGDTNGVRDIFRYELATGTTIRVSVKPNGDQVSAMSELPRISADGNSIVFTCYATDIVAGKTTANGDIFVRNVTGGTTTRVSVSSAGAESNGVSYRSDISGDGNTVVFESYATNLTVPATGGNSDIFVHDISSGQTTQVSVSTEGVVSNAFSLYPTVSADGMRITFLSDTNNLVAGDTNSQRDLFLYDRT